MHVGRGLGLAALALVTVPAVARAQVHIELDPNGGAVWQVVNGNLKGFSGFQSQIEAAKKLYGLNPAQAEKLSAWLADRVGGTGERTGAQQKLESAATAMKEAGIPFDEDLTKQKAAAMKAELIRYRAETRARFREDILDDAQRKVFDATQAESNDPLTGEPADENLPNHDPAKFKAFADAQAKQWQEQMEAAQGAQRAAKVFNGKGFVEEEWAAWLEKTGRRAGMDDRQRDMAAEMLDMAKQAAADYRKAKEADYKKVAADIAALDKDPAADPAKRFAVGKAAGELSAPIDEIGKRFRKDVTELLTDEQRRKLGKR